MIQFAPTVYLVRHATPDWGRTDLPYHLPPGPSLTAQGQDEAAQLGRFLRQAGVTRLYASPLERARQTAHIAAQVAGVPFEQEAALAEWRPDEDAAAVQARLWPLWEQATVLSREAGPMALITHGGPISVMLEALGLAPETLSAYRRRFDRNNPLPPGGAWKVTRPGPEAAWDFSLVFMPENNNTNAAYV